MLGNGILEVFMDFSKREVLVQRPLATLELDRDIFNGMSISSLLLGP